MKENKFHLKLNFKWVVGLVVLLTLGIGGECFTRSNAIGTGEL